MEQTLPRVHGVSGDLRIGLGENIEVGDIGAMVAVVVDFHGPGVDMRFKRAGWIAQRRKQEWTCGRRRRGGRRLREYNARRGCGGRDTRSRAEKKTTR